MSCKFYHNPSWAIWRSDFLPVRHRVSKTGCMQLFVPYPNRYLELDLESARFHSTASHTSWFEFIHMDLWSNQALLGFWKTYRTRFLMSQYHLIFDARSCKIAFSIPKTCVLSSQLRVTTYSTSYSNGFSSIFRHFRYDMCNIGLGWIWCVTVLLYASLPQLFWHWNTDVSLLRFG